MINFPASMSEDDRISICKQLDAKDSEIDKIQSKLDALDLKYNGGLTYSEAQNLLTQLNQTRYMLDATHRELRKLNFRIVQYVPENGIVRPFDLKIERITLYERILNKIKSLVPFSLKIEKRTD